jgi:transcription antitermination factor NusG
LERTLSSARLTRKPPEFHMPFWTAARLVAWHREYSARWSPGIAGLVMNGERPARIPDAAIVELKSRERNGYVVLPAPPKPNSDFKAGDQLRVRSGPFTGFAGLCAGMAPQDRVAVLLTMFNAVREVALARDDVTLIDRFQRRRG